jgi:hypothetical protein
MIDDADGYSQLYHAGWRKARKPHRCGECYRQIERGEVYHYAGGMFDGEFWDGKQCSHCNAAAQLLVRECGGFLHAGVVEDLEEHISEPLPWRMQAARYVVAMRRGWKCIRKPGLMPVPVVDMANRREA